MDDTPEPMAEVARKPSVAVVGDGERFDSTLPLSYERVGYGVVDGDEAVRRVESEEADCVVSFDSDAPLALLERVRERDPEVPFVVFSDSVGRDEAIDAGVTEFVGLPVENGEGVARRLRRYAEGRRSERAGRRLDSFLRHTPDQIVIHDSDGEIYEVNHRMCEALGYDREELLDMNISGFEVGIDPEELDDIWSGHEYGDSVVVEGRHRAKDGTEFPVEVNIGKVLLDGRERFLAIVRDITKRETVEKSLRRLRSEHETVFENVQDPVFLVEVEDDGFVFRRLNPAYEEQVGVSEDEARGKTPRELFGDDVGSELAENYRRCVEEGKTLTYDETIEVPMGTRTYHTKITPVFSGGEVTAIVGSARDITEQEERERELERYETYVANTSDIISHLDEDGTIIYQSPAIERVLGVEQDEWIGDNVFEHVHPDDRSGVVEDYLRLVREPETTVENARFRMETGDGSYVWLEAVGTDRPDSDVGGVVVSSRDITEQKRREREIERSRDLLRRTERIGATGGWEIDRDGELRWTEGTRRIHGVDEGYEPTLEDAVSFYPPEDRETIEEAVEDCWDGETFDEEVRITTADGETRWIRSRGEPVREGGEVVGMRGAVHDITERKERERSLERYRSIIENFSDVVTLLDTDGSILYASPSVEEMLGYEPDEMVGDETFDYVHPDDKPHVSDEFESLLGNPRSSTEEIELRLRTSDGSYVWAESVATDRRGTSLGCIIVNTRDVTERKEREKDLEERKRLLEKRKEQIQFFNSLLRHDMLNSMTVIRGNADRLLDQLSEDDDGYASAEKIRQRTDDMVDLTERVRSVLRRITEDEARDLTDVDLAAVAEERAASVDDVYGVDVTVDVPDEAYVRADDFLDDVVDNLLINAVEHNDKDQPRVDVTVERRDDATVLRVADNGPGIPDEMKETVFRQGERGPSSAGVGFGLYFVESMVSEYGGDVYAEDNEPEGTVVTVKLPAPSEDRR